MARDLAPEVLEGIVERIPMGRMGSVEEIAKIVRFLVTEGTYFNGAVLPANGGLYL